MEDDNDLIIENYKEFMKDNLAVSKYNYFDGENKYYINKKKHSIFFTMYCEIIETIGCPEIQISIPNRSHFKLFHQLVHIPNNFIKPVLQHLENLVESQFNKTNLKYSIDGLENNHFQFRVYWFCQNDEPVLTTKKQALSFVQKFNSKFPEFKNYINGDYTSTPLIGSKILVDKDKKIYDKYLPLCRNMVNEQDLYNFSVLKI